MERHWIVQALGNILDIQLPQGKCELEPRLVLPNL